MNDLRRMTPREQARACYRRGLSLNAAPLSTQDLGRVRTELSILRAVIDHRRALAAQAGAVLVGLQVDRFIAGPGAMGALEYHIDARSWPEGAAGLEHRAVLDFACAGFTVGTIHLHGVDRASRWPGLHKVVATYHARLQDMQTTRKHFGHLLFDPDGLLQLPWP